MTHIPIFLPTPFFPPYPPSTHFLTAPSIPLEVRPLKSIEGSGERCKLPSWSGRSPAAKRYLVHFGLKCFWWGTFTRNMFFFGLFTSNNARSRNMRPVSIHEPPPPTGGYGGASTGSDCTGSFREHYSNVTLVLEMMIHDRLIWLITKPSPTRLVFHIHTTWNWPEYSPCPTALHQVVRRKLVCSRHILPNIWVH